MSRTLIYIGSYYLFARLALPSLKITCHRHRDKCTTTRFQTKSLICRLHNLGTDCVISGPEAIMITAHHVISLYSFHNFCAVNCCAKLTDGWVFRNKTRHAHSVSPKHKDDNICYIDNKQGALSIQCRYDLIPAKNSSILLPLHSRVHHIGEQTT